MPVPKNLKGQRFGRLVAVKSIGRKSSKSRSHYWVCQCDCGKTKEVNSSALICGATKSCGCYQRDIARRAGDRTRTHSMTKTTTYNVWVSMIQRCHNENTKDYPRYGGRGIFVCDDWRQFDNFFRDMGERPNGKSLDRIDNEKGYFLENCRWVGAKTQQRNKRNNRYMVHNGTKRTVAEWAERIGMKQNTLRARINNGWSEHDALTKPVEMRFSHEKNKKHKA